MNLTLTRDQIDDDVTIGRLSVDGAFECFSLEDTVRPDDEPKVYGETAIPYGAYAVDITMSPRFKRPLPLLLNVAGFGGVRIHPGNDAGDTEGCILVGQVREQKRIGRSQLAFGALFAKLEAAKRRGERITLVITS